MAVVVIVFLRWKLVIILDVELVNMKAAKKWWYSSLLVHHWKILYFDSICFVFFLLECAKREGESERNRSKSMYFGLMMLLLYGVLSKTLTHKKRELLQGQFVLFTAHSDPMMHWWYYTVNKILVRGVLMDNMTVLSFFASVFFVLLLTIDHTHINTPILDIEIQSICTI